jgi:hypothetical protein
MMGGVDGAVLERLAKIMGYMRVTPGAKPGKRLKKRDKQRLLATAAAAPSGTYSLKHPHRCPNQHGMNGNEQTWWNRQILEACQITSDMATER